MNDARAELSQILDDLKLSPATFRRRLAEEGHVVDARTLRRYLAESTLSSARGVPDWLLAAARQMAGMAVVTEWFVGEDEHGTRVVIHGSEPRFLARMNSRDRITSIEWWSGEPEDRDEWADRARRASVRSYHRAYERSKPARK